MLWMTSRQALNDMTDSVSTRLNSWRDRNFIGSSSLEDNWGKKIQVASNGNLKGLTSSRDNNSPRFWGKVFGTHSDQDEDGDFAGYHATTTGFAVGADKMLASQWVVGGALSYAYTYTRMTDLRDGDKINANSYQATGYLSRDFGKFYVDGIFAYARHNYESQRDTVVLGTAKADYNGDELAAKLIAGVPFQLAKNAKATLFGGVEWDQLYVDSFEESGGGPLSLNVDSNRAMSFRSLLGAKISMKYSVGQGITATPTVMVGWRHEFTNDALDSTSSFTGGGATFFTPGQTLAKNTMSLALGSSFQKSDRFSLNVMANADKSSGYVAYSGQVVGRWSF
jgi:outer membrane autotransporter protein